MSPSSTLSSTSIASSSSSSTSTTNNTRRSFATTNITRRRRRAAYEKYSLDEYPSEPPDSSSLPQSSSSTSTLLTEPVPLTINDNSSGGGGGGDAGGSGGSDPSLDDYTNKTSLSPWVPVPDSVARKIFDTATTTSPAVVAAAAAAENEDDEDNNKKNVVVHVELGCGDGRVCFTGVLDYGFHVQESVGIDVDQNVIQLALERKSKIHPPPPIDFIVADLLSSTSPSSSSTSQSSTSTEGNVWKDHVERASIITMYFEKSGLERIRNKLERSLRRNPNPFIQIFCCGYAMPGWESTMVETVLDMPVYYYEWHGSASGRGAASASTSASATQDIPLAADSFIDEYNLSSSLPNSTSPPGRGRGGVAGLYEQNENPGTGVMDQYLQKKNSTFRPDPLPGYHPDDLIDYGWDDFGDSTTNGGDDDENANGSDNDKT
mmetsp:Transcript_21761/g.51359  ORF Transcript_21761/g.51359 Transcript_21761/m.51359 type:complete len:433 (-) Transcript_21761:169-1467(-)